MQKLLKSKNIVLILLSIIMVMLISINVVNGSFVFSDGNNFKWIILVVIFYIYFSKVSEKYNKRLFTISSVYGVVISVFYILGFLATNEQIPSCKKDYILILARFSACFVAVTSFMIIIMDSLPKIKERIKNIKEYKFFTANKKSFILVAVILFLAYVPYILNYFPGNVLIDSVIQILQGLGAMELTNHHPVLHTGIIAICMHIGNGLFNSYQIGAFIYTLLQTICTSLIFSFCIYYMARKNVPVPIRVISLLFFMFCPTICFYTITMYNRTIGSQNNVHPGRFIGDDEKGNPLYSDARVLTIYELLIVFSLPKNWDIPEWASDHFIRAVIGEGVPPLLTKRIMQELVVIHNEL